VGRRFFINEPAKSFQKSDAFPSYFGVVFGAPTGRGHEAASGRRENLTILARSACFGPKHAATGRRSSSLDLRDIFLEDRRTNF
jgi:hypothetical protein